MRLEVTVTSATHRGSREDNEDDSLALVGDYAPCGTLALLAVADGIGGQGTGASASGLALRTLGQVFAAGCSISGFVDSDIPHLLRYALQKANAAVYQAQAEDEDLAGMGTTCVAAAVTADAVHLVWVGDSRAYLLRDGHLNVLTQDDWVKRNDGVTLVSRAVGWQPTLPLDPATHDLELGDQILLCTDGLTDALSEEAIAAIMDANDAGKACAALVQNAAAGPNADNVTVVLASVQAAVKRRPRTRRQTAEAQA